MGKFEMLCELLPAEVNWGDPITPQMVEEIVLAERSACAECVPSNWCDPILTGTDAVIGKVADCRPIEAVLLAVKARIMGRSNVRVEGPPERRSRGGNREAQLLGGPSRTKG